MVGRLGRLGGVGGIVGVAGVPGTSPSAPVALAGQPSPGPSNGVPEPPGEALLAMLLPPTENGDSEDSCRNVNAGMAARVILILPPLPLPLLSSDSDDSGGPTPPTRGVAPHGADRQRSGSPRVSAPIATLSVRDRREAAGDMGKASFAGPWPRGYGETGRLGDERQPRSAWTCSAARRTANGLNGLVYICGTGGTEISRWSARRQGVTALKPKG